VVAGTVRKDLGVNAKAQGDGDDDDSSAGVVPAEEPMNDWPKKWIAVVLSILFPPLGMLYLARLGWALIYFLVFISVSFIDIAYSSEFLLFTLLPTTVLIVCAVHAYRLAGRHPGTLLRPWYSRWYGLLGVSIFILVFAAIGIRSFICEPYVAPSRSMVPNFRQGDYLLVQKWGYGNYGTLGIHLLHRPISSPLERGDVVVFEYPLERPIFFLKRIIGLPGDKISYRNSKLSINDAVVPVRRVDDYPYSSDGTVMSQYVESMSGQEYSVIHDPVEPLVSSMRPDFVQPASCTPYPDGLECVVPAGHYFVLGDNRDNSSDSRFWGMVPSDHMVGKVVKNFGKHPFWEMYK
jgi:signal peptidase I